MMVSSQGFFNMPLIESGQKDMIFQYLLITLLIYF